MPARTLEAGRLTFCTFTLSLPCLLESNQEAVWSSRGRYVRMDEMKMRGDSNQLEEPLETNSI